ncbi:glycosyltransferase family 4 protein [Paraflavitalea sp. CAU 1676]|uniref:glycosyltransferase family 4 protein n=1 Tax=Paraflavitalea sp. CAU 1676 TaxID=3032598 RepID=UPI0023DA1978|nr:glycosyltransferase family 4 protein [Paraflavitalea sp. CAU 1676]MDF2187072.1 glycosyltransferase family 4 protein [Paraflavitalea sp. CAU 1676]
MKRLAIITTHPIQYNAPWFELLAKSDLAVKVFYTQGPPSDNGNFDEGFGRVIKWDIPLLEGYEYTFVNNVSANPGTGHFKGIINPTLNQEVTDWKPDAILVIGWSFDSHIKLMRRFHKKVTILFRGDSTLLDERPGFKKQLRRLFLKWVYRHIDVALYAGANNKAYFQAHGLKEKQLVFTPHAIDNTRFFDKDGQYARQASEWRASLGFRPDDIVVLFVGKLEWRKDPRILTDLARKLTNPKVKILMVGNGAMEPTIKKEAGGLANIKFVDFQNQSMMPVVYRLGDVFILPSTSETWGLALNEAMACGLPVIASDKVGAAVDLIKPDVNGFIFATGNLDDLHSKLEKTIEGHSLKAMGAKSAEIIRSWSFEQIVGSIRSVDVN